MSKAPRATLSIDCSHQESSIYFESDPLYLSKSRNPQEPLEEFLPRGVQEILSEWGHSLNQITTLYLLDGPGSFTGLRSKMAYLKGLFFQLNPEVFSLNGFEVLFYKAWHQGLRGDFLLIPTHDRLGFYVQLWTLDEDLEEWENDGSAGYVKKLDDFQSYPFLWGASHPLMNIEKDHLLKIKTQDLPRLAPPEKKAIVLQGMVPNYFKKHYADI